MITLMLLCFVIYMAARFCLKSSGQQTKARPIRSFEDYFQSKE